MNIRLLIFIAAREFFESSIVAYLCLTLVETFWNGLIINFFNLNYLLMVVLFSGVVMVMTEEDK